VDHAVNNATPAPPQAPPQASPFKPGGDLPNPLPNGAHRVISTLTAAQMRKMMEGVVLFGTGKEAQLNGYSSGGKTGTAQKIDPATHTYSKTMHVASFAGFAPVNNPVIAVAVVMDNPHGAYYGASVSAPVFAEVAQQILEYLGVSHDTDVRPPRPGQKPEAPIREDDTQSADVNALYDAVNDLPSDDPLRAAPTPTQPSLPAANTAVNPAAMQPASGAPQAVSKTPSQPSTMAVMIPDAKRLRVPSLLGLPVRKVIEQASAAGLEVRITGNGTVREQAPAPGTMVAPGTQIVVHCGR
jgi:cell division protein FtsI (penicillin-binding protein 3)